MLKKLKIFCLTLKASFFSVFNKNIESAKYFFNKLKHSPQKEFATMEGGEAGWEEHACKSKSHHGFLGIEKETVKRISDWIRSAR